MPQYSKFLTRISVAVKCMRKIWPRLNRDTESAENAQSLKKLEAGETPYSLSPDDLTQNIKLSVLRAEYRGPSGAV